LKPRIETIIRLRCGKCNCYLGKIPPPNCTRCNERIDDCNFVAPTPIKSGTLEKFTNVQLENLNDPYDNY